MISNVGKSYDTTTGFTGEGKKLTPGGHICRIQGARVQTNKNGGQMLVLAFDIAEGGEFDGFYKDIYQSRIGYNADAKWPGTFYVNILNKDGDTSSFFKGVIEAVEASNSGYNFRATGFEETTLKGKLIGFNFGEEEYMNNQTGQIAVSVKPRYAVSVERIREGVIPPAIKKLDPQYGAPAPAQAPTQFTQVDDDELPF